MAKNRRNQTATIPVGGTESNTITVPSNATLLGFFTPGVLTGANVSFKAGKDANSTPVPLKSGGSNYSLAVAVDGYYPVNTDLFQGVQYLSVVSDATEVAAREFTLVFGQTE